VPDWLLAAGIQPSSIWAVVAHISSSASPDTDALLPRDLALSMVATLSSIWMFSCFPSCVGSGGRPRVLRKRLRGR
jgi:hypothetical protein